MHTPILYRDHIYGVGKKQRGLWTCLDLEGNELWNSEGQASFELGGYVLADGMFFVLEGKTGVLRVLDADADHYEELASVKLLEGPDVWAPPVISHGKLLIRDLGKLICLDIAADNIVPLAGESAVWPRRPTSESTARLMNLRHTANTERQRRTGGGISGAAGGHRRRRRPIACGRSVIARSSDFHPTAGWKPVSHPRRRLVDHGRRTSRLWVGLHGAIDRLDFSGKRASQYRGRVIVWDWSRAWRFRERR